MSWTAELVCCGIAVYAEFAQEPAERFLDAVRVDLDERAEEGARTVRRLGRQETAIKGLLDGGTDRKRAAKLLPTDGREERIARYERHLHPAHLDASQTGAAPGPTRGRTGGPAGRRGPERDRGRWSRLSAGGFVLANRLSRVSGKE